MPNLLIHIGYHKSGTTTLQRSVFSNSRIGFFAENGGASLLATKELICKHPLDFDPHRAREAFATVLAKASRNDLVAVISQERLSGDPERGRYDFPLVFERVKSTFGDLPFKVLITIREQRQTLVALYRQYVRSGGQCTLQEFIRTPSEIPGWHAPCDPAHLLYDRLYAYINKHVDSSRILVLPLEMLHRFPDEYYSRLFSFVGKVTPENFATPSPSNTGLSACATEFQRRINWIGRKSPISPERSPWIQMRMRLVSMADRILPDSVSDRIDSSWQNYVDMVVGDLYKPSNTLLQSTCGLDLAALGYLCE